MYTGEFALSPRDGREARRGAVLQHHCFSWFFLQYDHGPFVNTRGSLRLRRATSFTARTSLLGSKVCRLRLTLPLIAAMTVTTSESWEMSAWPAFRLIALKI